MGWDRFVTSKAFIFARTVHNIYETVTDQTLPLGDTSFLLL